MDLVASLIFFNLYGGPSSPPHVKLLDLISLCKEVFSRRISSLFKVKVNLGFYKYVDG
jgi:hypothetical protein